MLKAHAALVVLAHVLALSGAGCSKSEPTGTNAAPLPAPLPLPPPSSLPPATSAPAAPAPPPAPTFGAAASAAGITGTLQITPSPVPVCPKTGTGIATLAWTIKGTPLVEVRIGKPDGSLFVKAGADGSKKTGAWVTKGSVFYLQNVAADAPLISDNTLAIVAADVIDGPCP